MFGPKAEALPATPPAVALKRAKAVTCQEQVHLRECNGLDLYELVLLRTDLPECLDDINDSQPELLFTSERKGFDQTLKLLDSAITDLSEGSDERRARTEGARLHHTVIYV